MRFALLIAAALLFASPTEAQTRYVWSGGNGEWSDASKWSPNGVPAATDTAVVDGASTSIVTLTAHTAVAGFEIQRQGVVAGDFDLTITDRFLWAGVGIEAFRGTGSITNAASSTLLMTEPTTSFQMRSGRTLVNDGRIVWDGTGSWRGAGRLVNNGEMELAMGETGSFGFIFSNLVDAITNTASGVIRRTGSGTALWSSGAVNEGLIRVEQGILEFGGFNSSGVRGDGSLVVEPGATLTTRGGVHIQSSLTGDALTLRGGQVRLSGDYDVATTRIEASSILQLNGASSTETLEMAAGRIEGGGDLTVTGSLAWTGGEMGGSGTTTLGPAVPLTIDGGRLGIADSRKLRTEGAVDWTGTTTLSMGGSATFENAGTLTSSGDGTRDLTFGAFTNTGTLIHDGGSLRFFSGMSNEGEVRIDAGTLTQQGSNSIGGTDAGRYIVADGARLEFVGGARTLTSTVEVVGAGTVAISPNGGFTTFTNHAAWRPGTSPGVLTIDSAWPKPASDAVIDIEIGGTTPGTDFDQLAVTGTATLGGTLRVTLTDGFTPALGDRFLILPAGGGATGAFDQLELPDGLMAFVEASAIGAELVIGTPVASEGDDSPDELALHPSAPNPVRGVAALRVDLPASARVRLAVYDALGREVVVLLDADRPAGTHTLDLVVDGLAPGVYVVRLVVGAEVRTQRLTVVR